jgi:hypothetical protein
MIVSLVRREKKGGAPADEGKLGEKTNKSTGTERTSFLN